MNAVDWCLVVLFALGAILGLSRGLVRIVIGILSLVVAFILASRYQDSLAAVLVARHVSSPVAHVAAYLGVFFLTMIAGGLVAWLVATMLKIAMLSWADRLAGAALGVVGAVLAAAFLVYPVVASTQGGSRQLASSKLAPYVTVVSDVGNAVAPDPVAKRYNDSIGGLRKVWRGEVPVPSIEEIEKKVDKAVKAVTPTPTPKATPKPAPPH